jgi:hypothetical protein
MQYDMIKTFVCKRQGHAVALDKVQVKIAYTGFRPPQHGGGKIKAGINVPWRKVGNVKPSSNTADEDILVPLRWQLREARGTQARSRGREHCIV